jgi:four helix bundle protein
MTLDEWVATVPRAIREDLMWKVRAFQIGTYLAHLATDDVVTVARDVRVTVTADQLIRCIGGIGAAIAEGYSRRSRNDRIRYYEYALGSANEAKSWYMAAGPALGREIVEDRLEYLARVSQLLLTMIQNERKGRTWGIAKRIPGGPKMN